MWAFLSGLLGLADPISKIAGKIADARIAAANATTDRERIASEERAKALEARQAVLVAEGGSKINTITRAILTVPVAVFLAKVMIYDKALGQWTGGRTDALDDNLWKVVAAVIAFYFLYEIVARVKR